MPKSSSLYNPDAVDISNPAPVSVRKPNLQAVIQAAEKRSAVKGTTDVDPEYGTCQTSCLSLQKDFGKMSGRDIEDLMGNLINRIRTVPISEVQANPNIIAADLATIDCGNKWMLQCEDNLSGCGKGCAELSRDFQAGGSVPLPVEARTEIYNREQNRIADQNTPRDENIAALTGMKCLLKYEQCLKPTGHAAGIAGSDALTLNPRMHSVEKGR